MDLDLYQNYVSPQYLKNEWIEFNKFSICIGIDEILAAIVMCKISQNFWPLTRVRILFLLNGLKMSGWNLTKNCIHRY